MAPDELTEDEKKYFDSGGESGGEDTAEPDTQQGDTPGEDTAGADTAEGDTLEGGEAEKAKADKEEKRTVPLSEVLEERHRRRALEDVVKRYEGVLGKLEGVLGKSEQEKEPDLPGKDDDLPGYLEGLIGRLGRRLEKVEGKSQEVEKFTKEQTDSQRFYMAYNAAAQEFAAEAPDFAAAREFLLKDRLEELRDLGYSDPAQRAFIVQREEESIVGNLFAQGVNPAKAIYATAKRRGYKAPEKGNGADKGEEKVKAPGSLASLRGGAAATSPTINAALKMSDKEFAEKFADDDAFRKLAGG